MHNRMGPTTSRTSGRHHPTPQPAAQAMTAYRSSSCAIGAHPECAQSSPATAPVGVPVIYEACDCSCHAPDAAPAPQQVNQ
ncbi:hypothetical protein [Streptomyces avidinii]|uniref:Uncharacterized protein n=1 Tax=Streptomyces avidinii TaxID=1895 RepID=A0ABS4L1U1_STRAV|nr:hypothetical protein [Streptomyces avidinii]MBP2036252.1 hypothetical protein [Streptomyces avidinii]GGY82897.1 hypothetical protein GCM10010343_04670 [Streptomyces avidinii]